MTRIYRKKVGGTVIWGMARIRKKGGGGVIWGMARIRNETRIRENWGGG